MVSSICCCRPTGTCRDAGTVFGKEIYKFSPWDSVFFFEGKGMIQIFWGSDFCMKKMGDAIAKDGFLDRLMLCFAGNGFSVPRSSASHGPQVPQGVGSSGAQPVAVDKSPDFLSRQDRD